MADLIVENHGSVALILPASPAGREWFDSHVEYESWAVLGSRIAVDHRYVAPIVDGAVNDGLEVA